MFSDYTEDFILLECVRTEDGLGGVYEAYEESMCFCGGVTSLMSREITRGESAAESAAPVLVHEWGVTLRLGDVVRRVSDGVCYRVTGCSSDMRTPAIAGFAFAQVNVERLVDPL